jgi:hypothetical protein
MTTVPFSDPRVHRLEGPLSRARLDGTDPVTLSAQGRESLVVAEPVVLGVDDEFDVRFLRLLREAMSMTMTVDWSGDLAVPFDPRMVRHLPPPRQRNGDGADPWRAEFRFGLCFYQVGPGFVLLKDTRDGSGARYRIDDERAVSAWHELGSVRFLPDASPEVGELCELLSEEELVMRRGQWVTLLPFRMRRWPVPFDAI